MERKVAVRSETVRPQRRFPPHEMRMAASNKHGGGNPIEGRGDGLSLWSLPRRFEGEKMPKKGEEEEQDE